MELDTQLKCFIPDYLPAVGEMDAFLKVQHACLPFPPPLSRPCPSVSLSRPSPPLVSAGFSTQVPRPDQQPDDLGLKVRHSTRLD